MPEHRHIIRRQTPQTPATFESQVWPVATALFVTGSLGLIAAITTLDGNLRWASILLIPAALWTAFLVLQRVGNQWLRRSLQFAVLCSLAIHLLLIIIASATDVFGGLNVVQPQPVQQKSPSRVLLTSRSTVEPIWEKINNRAVEDPELSSARVATSTQSDPSPVEIKRSETRNDSTPTRRESANSQTVPRFDKSLSQRRRSETGSTPSSAVPTAVATNQKAANAAAATPTESSSASPSQRMIESESSSQQSESTPAAASPTGRTNDRELARRNSPSRIPELADNDSSSRAATRNRNERMPEASAHPARSAETMVQPKVSSSSKPKQPIAAQTSRRATSPGETVTPNSLQSAQRPQSSQSMNRPLQSPKTNPAPPSIVDNSSSDNTPRRSRTHAPRATSLAAAETPSLAMQPSSQSGSQPQPSATSITRAETAGALANASEGMAPQSALTSGTSSAPSNSRRQTESSAISSDLQLMQNQQTSRNSQLNPSAPVSGNPWKSNTSQAAIMAGSESPAETSHSSPQSQTTSSTRDASMEMAVQPGESIIDSRLVKQSGDNPRHESGGGGRPEIDVTPSTDETAARTRGASQMPSLNSEIADTTAASRSPSSSEAADGTTPSEASTQLARGDNPDANAESEGPSAGDSLSESRTDRSSADSSRVPESDSSNGTALAVIDDDDDDENEQRLTMRNNPRSQAPSTASAISVGSESGHSPGSTQDFHESRQEANTAAGRRQPGPAGIENDGPTSLGSTQSGRQSGSVSRISGKGEAPGDRQLVDSQTGQSSERSRSQLGAPSAEASSDFATGPIARNQTASAEAGVTAERIGPSLEMKIKADIGASGLADHPDPSLGTPIRPSSRDSQSIQLDAPSRFVRETPSADPGSIAAAAMARQAFQARQPAAASSSPSTEAAIELGLEFLARHQQPDGSWALEMFDTGHPRHSEQLSSSTAATGLAVLAFQGAGYHHRDFKYAQNLQRALAWIVEHQSENGDLYVPSNLNSNRYSQLYSHAIAGLAITEAYGMTQDPALRLPCEKAIGFIVATQDPERGGWRYLTGPGQLQTDTSVTGWMMMVLQSARLCGLEVPESTISKIESWLGVAHDPANPSLFRYDPYANNSGSVQRIQHRNASPSMTAVGLLMRIYTGADKNSLMVQQGADYLLETMPSYDDGLRRDTYYWYYATQVLRHAGGNRWQRWNERLHPLLVESQDKTGEMAGSWDPYLPVPDRWGPFAGRLYVTTMNLLSLEVDYRLLPLYEKTIE